MSSLLAAAPTSTHEPIRPVEGTRFAFLDGLRAFGALGVAVYHIQRYGPLAEPASSVLPAPIRVALEHGWMGVQIFFVISGFVIAHSLRKVRIGSESGLLFLIRRYVRLTPPYLLTAALVISLTVFAVKILKVDTLGELPRPWQVLAHVAYLQDILGHGNLSTGFWMLCIEMQFYVLYVVLLGIAQRLSSGGTRTSAVPSPTAVVLCFWLPGLLLLSLYHPVPHLAEWFESFDPEIWAPYFFGVIAFGIVTYAVLENWIGRWAFWCYALVMFGRLVIEWTLYREFGREICVGLLAGVSIYACQRANAMRRWLNFQPIQFIGRISYSLFLIHYPVSWIVTTLGHRLTGVEPYAALGWLVASFALSILAAWALCVWIEEPAAELSRRVGQARTAATAP